MSKDFEVTKDTLTLKLKVNVSIKHWEKETIFILFFLARQLYS